MDVYASPLHKYHDYVKQKKIVVCKDIKNQIAREKKFLKKYDFDPHPGNKAIKFIETYCRHYEGKFAGQKIKLSLWQKWIVCSIFGFYGNFEVDKYNENGELIGTDTIEMRVAKDVLLAIASGNGKTTFLGAINAYLLFGAGVDAPKIYIGSNAYQQSRLCFEYTEQMIRQSKELMKYSKIRQSDIRCTLNNGKLIPMSSDGKNFEGINPSVIVIDEIHEMKDGKYVADLKKSVKREDLFTFEITTFGTHRGGYLDNRIDYCESLLENKIENDRCFPFIFKQDTRTEIFRNSRLAVKSNPNLGISINVKDLEDKLNELKDNPMVRGEILTKNFNVMENESSLFFTNRECQVNSYDEERLVGTYGYFGLDMSMTGDLTALTYLTVEEGEFLTKTWFFIAAGVLEERINSDKVDYKHFQEIGDLIILDGEYINQVDVLNYIYKIVDELELGIIKCGIDPYHADMIMKSLRDEYGKSFVIATKNEYRKANTPTIYRMKNLLKEKAIFFNSKLLSLHLSNCSPETDKDGFLLLVKKRQRGRIDGMWSLIYAKKAEELKDMK